VSGARSSPPGHTTVHGLGIDRDLGKTLGRSGIVEHGPTQAIEDIDLAAQPVGEGQLKDAMTDDGGCGYVGRKASHRSGSIS
jgi:hypothetical protein